MSTLNTLETLLSQFELYEPELGREFRFSPHVLMLGLGRSELTAWEASALNFFYGPANTAHFEFFANALRLPPKLEAAVLRTAQATPNAWWQPAFATYERIERIRVSPAEFELRYADKHGHYQMRLIVAPPSEEQRATIATWLTTGEDLPLRAVARGTVPDYTALKRWGLIPAWETLTVSASSKAQTALELGIRFLCRTLVTYPAHLLIWRGIEGETVVRNFIKQRLNRRQEDFATAIAALPAAAADFWAAPTLPELASPHLLTPDAGLGAHLPPVTFWPNPHENQLFMDTLAKVYKAVPKKVIKLTHPKR